MKDEADAAEIRAPRADRLRLKGVVEETASSVPAQHSAARDKRAGAWKAAARQSMLIARATAAFMVFAALAGWPLGKYLAWRAQTGGTGSWNYLAAFDGTAILVAIFFPLLTMLFGYWQSRQQQMIGAAEEIAAAARQFIHPDDAAADNARHVGLVVREQMDALNVGLDGALNRLASVEAMIRKHVTAIEAAGAQVDQQATGAVSRVAEERVRLIELTEHLNTQADAFARAIAEKARASIDALHTADNIAEKAEGQLEERLVRLDASARQALDSFNALSTALADAHQGVAGVSEKIDAASQEAKAASERASKFANAAAEDAARNAANIGASAARAAEEAKRAADASIESATREAERASMAAYEAAEREAARVADMSAKLLGDVRKSTSDLISSVSADTDKAQTFAARMTDAANLSVEASRKAAAELAKANERVVKEGEATLAAAEQAAAQSEARNKSLVEARAALEAENIRLEKLIGEQRERADRLADAIASQTERLSKLAEAQLREQEAQMRLATQNRLKAQEEEAAKAMAHAARVETERLAREEAERKAKADGERRAREEAARADAVKAEAAAKAEASAKAEAERLSKADAEKRAAEAQKPSLVERAMKSANDDVLDLGKTVRMPKTEGPPGAMAKPRGNGAAKSEPPLTLSDGKPADAKRGKEKVSWREILDKTDEAEPLDLGAVNKGGETGSEAIRIIGDLQRFTLNLETRLYGDPPPALKERFDRGDRNVFANRILRLNEADVKRRIRVEADRDRAFEKDIQGFLQGFEKLLEDATTSDTADEDLEEYLSSPLGRVYLLIGAMVGYFA